MARRKATFKAGEAAAEAELAVAETFAPYQDSLAGQAVTRFAKLGDEPPLRILCGAIVAAGLARGDPKLAGAGLKALFAHTAATLAKDALKRRIDRTRPFAAVEGKGDNRPRPGRREDKEETSFPSGHSAGAAAVSLALARVYPEARGPLLAAGGLLALAQIPRCAHYPSDVGGGLLLGAAAEAVTDALIR